MRIFRTQSQKLWTVVLLGTGACVLGVAYAVFLGVASDGGRGGAVAVALAFATLFTSAPAVRELIEAPDNSGILPSTRFRLLGRSPGCALP